MSSELKSIDEVPKTDETELTQLEKTALDAFFPQSKQMSLPSPPQPSTPIMTNAPPSLNTNLPVLSSTATTVVSPPSSPSLSKTAITAVLLTVLYLVLSSGNVTRLVDRMVNSKHQVISSTQILFGKVILFAIVAFLILYYYN
jgi:hypothetical protein